MPESEAWSVPKLSAKRSLSRSGQQRPPYSSPSLAKFVLVFQNGHVVSRPQQIHRLLTGMGGGGGGGGGRGGRWVVIQLILHCHSHSDLALRFTVV